VVSRRLKNRPLCVELIDMLSITRMTDGFQA
jgi:hypothetical protein